MRHLAVLLAAIAAGILLLGQPAPCDSQPMCLTDECYSRFSCGVNCFCFRIGDELMGRCVSFNALP